jgi:hypothetical protein
MLFWLGVVVDTIVALFLVIVFGFVLDSWHDPNGRWVGIVVTLCWGLAFAGCVGAIGLGWWLRRRNAPASRVLLTVWGPLLVFGGLTMIGFLIAPP